MSKLKTNKSRDWFEEGEVCINWLILIQGTQLQQASVYISEITSLRNVSSKNKCGYEKKLENIFKL